MHLQAVTCHKTNFSTLYNHGNQVSDSIKNEGIPIVASGMKRSSHEAHARSHRQKQNEGRTRMHDLFTEIT
jgi:hypothetical protein